MLEHPITPDTIVRAAGMAAVAYTLHRLLVIFIDPLRTVPGALWARFTLLWE